MKELLELLSSHDHSIDGKNKLKAADALKIPFEYQAMNM